MSEPILSCFQAQELLMARSRGEPSVNSSLDLGRSKVELSLDAEGLRLPEGQRLGWRAIEEIAGNDSVCFRCTAEGIEPIRGFSDESQRTYQLMPTLSAPALLISGFVMHRLRDVSPVEGARRMVRALGTVRGRVLDTTTGLGYAVIEASLTADQVVTIEVDPWAQTMARQNPWSAALFENPKISQLLGDSSLLVPTLPSESFSFVVHDPPAINVAGELYAESFYQEILRVLRSRGRLFHYIGDPQSASGARTTKGVVKRLLGAGFQRVVPAPDAFGVVAFKS